jgi:hypothetical protein
MSVVQELHEGSHSAGTAHYRYRYTKGQCHEQCSHHLYESPLHDALSQVVQFGCTEGKVGR